MPEIPNSGDHRIGRRHAQPAEARVLDVSREVKKQVYVAFPALPFCNPCKNLKKPLCADPARSALAAGFSLGEFKKKTGHVNHAVGLVKDHHSA